MLHEELMGKELEFTFEGGGKLKGKCVGLGTMIGSDNGLHAVAIIQLPKPLKIPQEDGKIMQITHIPVKLA